MASENLLELLKYDPRFLFNIYVRSIDTKNKPIEELYDKYFSDHIIQNNDIDNRSMWLQRNNDIFYYVEENKDYYSKLFHLLPKYFKAPLPFCFAFGHRSLLCLNDSWTCLGWIDTILSNKKKIKNNEITLIHFDSHPDMGAPLLARDINSGAYYDLLSQNQVKTDSLFDFMTSISIGSIGISNFISILPLFFKNVNIYYINQFTGINRRSSYKLDFVYDDVFTKKNSNLLRMKNIYAYDVIKSNEYPHSLVESNDIECLKPISNEPIFLHFDMDYFNNQLDGSAVCFRKKNNNPSLHKQLEEIDRVTEQLHRLRDKIIHVSIALSPGFFPSKYWEPSTQHLIKKLNHYDMPFSIEKVFPSFDVI
jgi:hypothetical protein